MCDAQAEYLRSDDEAGLAEAAQAAAEQALVEWGIPGEARLLKRLESFIFAAGKGGEHILRVTEPAHRSRGALEAELDWLRHLDARGVRVAGPIPSRGQRLVETMETRVGPLHVATFRRAPGRPFDFRRSWHAGFHRELGELMGAMHAATRSYSPTEGLTPRESWADDLERLASALPEQEREAREELEVMRRWAAGLPVGPDCHGLVHTDLNYSNLFVDDLGRPTAFDFDDCRHHWFAYDLAVPLFYALVSFDLPDLDPTRQGWFFGPLLEGYARHASLTDEWRARIPAFVRLRRIELFAFMHEVLDMEDLSAWDRQAMQRMRAGFAHPEPLL